MASPEGANRTSLWAGLGTGRKIAIAATAIVVLSALLLLLVQSSGGEYSLLYANLSPEDAAKIVEHLKDANVNYRLASGGSAIRVPANKVYELRMEVASKGYPQGGGMGFELFDRMSFGATEFTQKVNYIRALQGELSRTIMSLSPVSKARVHLVMPEPRLLAEQTQAATASIVLEVVPMARLTDLQIRGIVNLVSSAVEGLSPQHITVVDAEGNLLWRGDSSRQPGSSMLTLTSTQLEMKMAYEREMQTRIESMLERVLGLGRAVVRVNAEINFDHMERQSEILQPGANGLGVPVSEQTMEERRSGGSMSGPSGTDSNLPIYPLIAEAGSASSSHSRVERTINYEISKTVERSVISGGKLERISVAAFVDAALTDDRVDSIRRAIAAAAGLVESRGDQVVVTSTQFAQAAGVIDTALLTADDARADRRDLIMLIARAFAPVILGILLFIFAITLLRMFRKTEPAEYEQPVGMRVDQVLEQEVPSPAAIRAQIEDQRRAEIKEAVEKLAKSKPADVARLLQGWMSEE